MTAPKKILQTYRQYVISDQFVEDPVDIWTFMSDPRYLGNATNNGNCSLIFIGGLYTGGTC